MPAFVHMTNNLWWQLWRQTLWLVVTYRHSEPVTIPPSPFLSRPRDRSTAVDCRGGLFPLTNKDQHKINRLYSPKISRLYTLIPENSEAVSTSTIGFFIWINALSALKAYKSENLFRFTLFFSKKVIPVISRMSLIWQTHYFRIRFDDLSIGTPWRVVIAAGQRKKWLTNVRQDLSCTGPADHSLQ